MHFDIYSANNITLISEVPKKIYQRMRKHDICAGDFAFADLLEKVKSLETILTY